MKKRLLITICSAAAVILLTLLGNRILSPGTTVDQALPPIDDPGAIYDNAAKALESEQDLDLTISTTIQTTVDSSVFLEIAQQNLFYREMGTDSFCAELSETLTIDSHSVQIHETYAEGAAYVALGDGYFSTPLSPEAYLARFAPAVLLDAQLYGSITGVDTGEGYMLSFAQASAPEAWFLKDTYALLEAAGTAYISYEGQLTKSIYTTAYSKGEVTYRQTVIVEASSSSEAIQRPDAAAMCTAIEYFDAPRQLERATGYLLQAQDVSAVYEDSTYFQAFGDKCDKEITLHTHRDEAWSARVDTIETLTNDSRIDQASKQHKTELFANNQYSVSTNDAAAVVNPEISVNEMYSYCRNLLVSTVMLPQHIAGAQMTETDGIQRITFSGNEAFAALISSNTCQVLYKEPEMLNSLAQSTNTDTLECYLEVDSSTGLPVSSGILYNGTYMIEGLPYQLAFQADQSYDLLSKTAYEAIFG